MLFGSSKAHVEIRKLLIEENRLDGVISMPSGVFRPTRASPPPCCYSPRAADHRKIWFYDMEHDGFSLDDNVRMPERTTSPTCLTAGNTATMRVPASAPSAWPNCKRKSPAQDRPPQAPRHHPPAKVRRSRRQRRRCGRGPIGPRTAETELATLNLKSRRSKPRSTSSAASSG